MHSSRGVNDLCCMLRVSAGERGMKAKGFMAATRGRLGGEADGVHPIDLVAKHADHHPILTEEIRRQRAAV